MPSTADLERIAVYSSYFTRPLDDVVHDLSAYARLLTKWQNVQNLVSRETLSQLWTRHFADSLQVLRLVEPDAAQCLDLGSGGGFPALPLSIGLKGDTTAFTLVEPTSRKVSFLRTVARDLSLHVAVDGRRIEQIDSRETPPFNVITSRALAELGALFSMASRFVHPQTRLLLHKGREHVEELRSASALWQFDVVIHPSDTSAEGVILEIRNLQAR